MFVRPEGTVLVDASTVPSNLTNNSARPAGATAYQWDGVIASGQTTNLSWGYYQPGGGGSQPPQLTNVTGLLKFGFRKWVLNRGTGTLLGTLGITNVSSSQLAFGPPFELGLHTVTATNFYYPHPAGKLPNNVAYVDLTAAMNARLSGGVLHPGQSVVLTNAVEVYSRTRNPPAKSLFEFWATPGAVSSRRGSGGR